MKEEVGSSRGSIKFKKRYFLLTLVSLCCLLVILYHLYFISNSIVYNAISYSVPFLLVVNFLVFIYFLYQRHIWLWAIPFFIFVIGFNVVQSFFSFSIFSEDDAPSDIEVLSYNVGTFNLDRFHQDSLVAVSDSLVMNRQEQFLLKCKADVVCIQEFYHNDELEFSNILNEMASIGYKYFYTTPIHLEEFDGLFGVITFSKFPIVNRGRIKFDYFENNRAINNAIYTDLLVGSDTIRIFNVHLHSMDLGANKVLKTNSSDMLVEELTLFKEKMNYGFNKRGEQVEKIELLLKGSKMNTILVGDLNDLPFSFTYRTLRKYLYNSFENAGFGFGFTYNKFPWFIRIDNQFYSKKMKVNYFKIQEENPFSDHYPIRAGYSILEF